MAKITFRGNPEIPNSRMPQKVTSNPARITSIGKFKKLAALILTIAAMMENNINPKSLNNNPLRGVWGKVNCLPESEIKTINNVARPAIRRISVDQVELNCTDTKKIPTYISPMLINAHLGLLADRNVKQPKNIKRRGKMLIQFVMRSF